VAIKKTISGIRGTIGGKYRENLTPLDVVECVAGFGQWIIENNAPKKVVVGRDGRITGPIVSALAINTLISMGIDVVDLGLSTTPTVEIAVPIEGAGAGIIFTASHNPKNWNALKFLNGKGEFISALDGKRILDIIDDGGFDFALVDDIGKVSTDDTYITKHIDAILDLDFIDTNLIKSKKFNVVVDCINSTGAISIPPLLDRLGCSYTLLNEEINGEFAHNPEPLPAHLVDLSEAIVKERADFGISVDPDVDRLAFVSDDGEMFGEEYTLVALADFLLPKKPGNTVSNLSSTRALKDVTVKHGGSYTAAAVGEVNVVNKMKETNAIIGGEGNGGVILPDLHYGRDALVGIAMMLNHLAEKDMKISELKKTYPAYEIRKHKIQLTPAIDVASLLDSLKAKYKDEDINTIDGLKINFEEGWVHLRESNTEPILRVYSESVSGAEADKLAEMIKSDVQNITG
jgi:phosphomannomutase